MLRTIVAGREELPPGHDLPRHRHRDPYAIVVLRGRFAQVSYAGRVEVREGELLIQPPLDCHANRLITAGASIVRLPWPACEGLGGVYELADAGAVARAAERDVAEAVHLAAAHRPRPGARADDWVDELAAALVDGTAGELGRWAEERGLARETVSRGFTAAYGVPARQFRAELRARAAWLEIVRGGASLARIAAATGFADQPHMTRSVRALTGRPPAAWRT